MKYFPVKSAIFCLLVTPILYLYTLNLLQESLTNYYHQKIENIYIGDSSKLLSGSLTVEEQIGQNIYSYINANKIIHYTNLELSIIITSKAGKIIFPAYIVLNEVADNFTVEQMDPESTAKYNFQILNDGLNLTVNVNLNHASFLGFFFLIFYFGIACIIIFILFKISGSKLRVESRKKKELIKNLKEEEEIHHKILNELKKERQGLFENIKALNSKFQEGQKKAKINEDEMFSEIISLEEQINSYIDLKHQKDEEINELKNTISKYERRKGSKNRRNEFNIISKRFAALYKNIIMNRKALSGFMNLNEDQQIKSEEIIVMLDRNPKLVTIKRKVFLRKKHKTTSFEVLFSYNGRLYFRKNENNSIEVLVIGTKNTQTKDMDFLHKL